MKTGRADCAPKSMSAQSTMPPRFHIANKLSSLVLRTAQYLSPTRLRQIAFSKSTLGRSVAAKVSYQTRGVGEEPSTSFQTLLSISIHKSSATCSLSSSSLPQIEALIFVPGQGLYNDRPASASIALSARLETVAPILQSGTQEGICGSKAINEFLFEASSASLKTRPRISKPLMSG